MHRPLFFALFCLLLTFAVARTKLPHAIPYASAELLALQEMVPLDDSYPTLSDFWDGRAEFVIDIEDTGLPRGESETLIMQNGEWWSYVHASDRSAGVVDRCGDPVEFPGCTVIYRSEDGRRFTLTEPVCQFECRQCPCNPDKDHTPQQQYPRVYTDGRTAWLVYEYLSRVMLRRSADGVTWSLPERVGTTGFQSDATPCMMWELIGPHPFTHVEDFRCLAGGPPGIFVEGGRVYVFVGMGQSPGHLGCFVGSVREAAVQFRPCTHNPLLSGADSYGPLEAQGEAGDPYWDFRMVSSAEVIAVGEQYYLLYEGIRGPGPNDPGDTQFGVGLARTVDGAIDGRWEKYPHNPLLQPLPGNIGVGHADLVVHNGETILFTSLDGETRSRLKLVWKG